MFFKKGRYFMEIIELLKGNEFFEIGIQEFWKQWGSEDNFKFYEDAIIHSSSQDGIPQFNVAIDNGVIVGTYALLRNDLNSRQDLYPWFACLYVNENHRGRELGAKLLQHGLENAANKGYSKLYLTTDLVNYYEKYGWKNSGSVYGVSGEAIKLYERETAF